MAARHREFPELVISFRSLWFRVPSNANMLFDELTIDRFRSLTSDGYAIVNIGVFILFGIQDWQNWNFSAANTLLIDLSAMMFLVWGGLMVVFVVKEWPEASYGEAS